MFNLKPTQGPTVSRNWLRLRGVEITLTKAGADALNAAFGGGATPFAEGLLIGTASVKARIAARFH